MHKGTHCVIICLLAALPRYGKGAGQSKIVLKIVLNAACIGITGHNGERGGGEKILGHRAPQIPNGLNGGVFFLFDKRFRIQIQKLPQAAQKLRGGLNSDRGLEIGLVEQFTKPAAKFPVHADIHIGIHQTTHFSNMCPKRHHHIDFCADALDQASYLSQI